MSCDACMFGCGCECRADGVYAGRAEALAEIVSDLRDRADESEEGIADEIGQLADRYEKREHLAERKEPVKACRCGVGCLPLPEDSYDDGE